MRAYIRIDPELAERKEGASDGLFRAFIKTLCYAEQQPHRGRFKTLAIYRAYLGHHARFIAQLVTAGDVTAQTDGSFYVTGWDEWQEGDVTVAERVSRIRNRRKVTADVTPDVTVPVTGDRLAVSNIATSGKHGDKARLGDSLPPTPLNPQDAVENGAKAPTTGTTDGVVIASKGWRGGEVESTGVILKRLRIQETHG